MDYEVLAPVTDAVAALGPDRAAAAPGRQPGPPPQDPQGRSRRRAADVVVTGDYEVGMQDQAFLGPEAGLAVPDGEGGVDLYVATQWLHVDQRQICAALGLPPEQVRLTLAGVGGAFGGREDLSMHVHACLLALHTGKPVKMMYSREESFFGHVHRHPATMRYEHGANQRRHAGLRQGGDLPRRRRVRLQHPGRGRQRAARWASGRTSCRTCTWTPTASTPTTRRAARCAASARCRPRSATRRRWTSWRRSWAWTRSSSAAATRWSMGSEAPTGQIVDSPAPVAELLRRLQADAAAGRRSRRQPTPAMDLRALPGGVAQHHARRGGRARHRLRRRLTRTSASPRASTTTRRPGYGSRSIGGEPVVDRAHRRRRGGPGPGHRSSSRSAAPSSAWSTS